MDRRNVLITGGAGFLGINLVRHLEKRGYALASLDVEEFDYPERDRVEVIRGDIRDKALLDWAMEGADLVVHTAAALPLYSPEDIRSEEHTSELQSRQYLVCRLLLEKKNHSLYN